MRRAPLLLAGLGAVVVLVDVFSTAGDLAGAAFVLVGTLGALASPAPDRDELNWRALLVPGAALVVLGAPLELFWETPGGLLAGVGGVLVVVAVALGLP